MFLCPFIHVPNSSAPPLLSYRFVTSNLCPFGVELLWVGFFRIRTLAESRWCQATGSRGLELGDRRVAQNGALKCSCVYLTSHPPLPCVSTMPPNWGLWRIAGIYELNKELSTFVIEYSGAWLSLLRCLEAFVCGRFYYRERSLCFLPPCLGTSCAVPQCLAFPASPSPEIPRRATRWRCS